MDTTTALEVNFLDNEEGTQPKTPIRLEIILLENGSYALTNFYEYNLQYYVLTDWLKIHKDCGKFQKSYQEFINSNKKVTKDDIKMQLSDIPDESINSQFKADSIKQSMLSFEHNTDMSFEQQSLQLNSDKNSEGKLETRINMVEGRQGSIYEGYLIMNKANGFGVCTWPNGDKYIGQWGDDKKHGKGCYIWVNGAHYFGDYTQNLPNGRGEYRYVNGDKYYGDYELDCKQGYGEYTWKNGDIFKGMYKAGKQHGSGTFVSIESNRTEEQNWEDGVRIS